MSCHFSEQQVRDIARVAHVGLTCDELPRMTADLNAVMDLLEPVTHYDLEGVPPTFHPIAGLTNAMRADKPTPGLTREAALENAPEQQDGCFVVASILGKRGDC